MEYLAAEGGRVGDHRRSRRSSEHLRVREDERSNRESKVGVVT